MPAFIMLFVNWIGSIFVKYIITTIRDLISNYIKRRQEKLEQQQKDKENLKRYDEAIKNGNAEEVRKATDALLND